MGRGLRGFLIILGVIIAAAAVLIFGFRIRTVSVQGNSRYSAEQIQADLIHDRLTENTLYFAWKYRAAGTSGDAPYLTSVRAQMTSPTAVKITVTESTLVGRVQYQNQNVYFDEDGIVQMITDEVYSSVPLITGVDVQEPVVYQKLSLDNPATLRTMLSITQLLIQADFIPDSVSFDANGNMTLRFQSIKVKIGQDEYLEEKISNLLQIYPKIASQNGTLNMEGFTGKNENVTFKSDQQQESKTETDYSGGQTLTGVGADSQENGDQADSSAAGSGETSTGGSDAQNGSDTSTGSGAQDSPDSSDADASSGSSSDGSDSGADGNADSTTAGTGVMAFDSSGTLHYDARIVDGQVVDANGNPIAGCSVDENGNIKDAYWNVIDPVTGSLVQ